MKKAKIFSLLALTLCFIMVFASCGSGNVLKYYNTDYEETKPLAVSTKVEGLGVHSSCSGDLVLFIDDTVDTKIVYKVYNIATGLVVYTQEVLLADTLDVSISLNEIDGASYFTVTTKKAGKVTNAKLYSAAGGTAVAESANDPNYAEHNNEVIAFNGVAYVADENGAIVKSFDIDELSHFGSADIAGTEYNYSSADNTLVITDKKGNFVSGYSFKSYNNSEHKWYVLADGNILIQYYNQLPEDAADYDVFTEGKKLDIVTEIFSVKKASAKEIKFSYIVNSIINVNSSYYKQIKDIFAKNMDINYASAFEIVDQRIDENAYELVFFDNDLSVKASANELIDGARSIYLIADDLFRVEDKYGNISFIRKNGKTIKTVNGEAISGVNEKYIWTEKSVYDYTFTKVYDLKSNGCKVADHGPDYIIISKNTDNGTEYSKLVNGTVAVIVADNVTDSQYVSMDYEEYTRLYCIRTQVADGTVSYNYYNGTGALIGSFKDTLDIVGYTDGGVYLVKAAGEYFRLTPKA